jgi:hypothetical protein
MRMIGLLEVYMKFKKWRKKLSKMDSRYLVGALLSSHGFRKPVWIPGHPDPLINVVIDKTNHNMELNLFERDVLESEFIKAMKLDSGLADVFGK